MTALIVGSIFIIVGCIFIWFNIMILISKPRLKKHGVDCCAKVTSTKSHKDGTLDVVIEYIFNEKKYTDFIMALVEQSDFFWKGKIINIKIKAKNPNVYIITDEINNEPSTLSFKKSSLNKYLLLLLWLLMFIYPGVMIILEQLEIIK